MHHIWKFAAVPLGAALLLGMSAIPAYAEDSTEPETAASETVAGETTANPSETPSEDETELSSEPETESPSEEETEAASEAGTVSSGWEEYDGKRYYRLESGAFATGETEIDGVSYLFGFSGAQKTDWQTVDGRRFYYDPESGEPVFGWFDYFGERYYVDSTEGKLTGAQTIGEEHYTFEEDGSLLRGYFRVDGQRYYSDPETGLTESNAFFDVGRVLFTDEVGTILSGWQELDGKRYYISPETGFAQYGLFEMDGASYLGTPNGLVTGEYWLGDSQCWFDPETGAMCEGLFEWEGTLRYFDRETMQCIKNDFVTVESGTYYFGEDGCAVKGLLTLDGAVYCFDESGAMLRGFQMIGDRLYFFEEETGRAYFGALETEDGVIRFAADGGQLFGWETVGEDRYYTDENGYVLEGWQTLGDKDYKFDAQGLMISDGRLYNQYDPKWKEVTFGPTESSSMYTSACGIFSFCNAIFSMNRIEADAVEVAEWAISVKAFRPGAGGTYREILYNNIEAQYGEELNFTLGGQIWGKITDSRLTDHLQTGGAAVIHVSGHFMAVTGYDAQTGLYHVLESAVSDKRGLEGDSWVDADKMSTGNTKVDWFVLISPRNQ